MLFGEIPIKIGSTVSFVGAGGKTSLMFSLASELSSIGYKVLVTTTTAIFHPYFSNLYYTSIVLGRVELWEKSIYSYDKCLIVAASKYNKKNRKLIGYTPQYIDLINGSRFFDFVFVEADGAKMKSIKCPNNNEPVIPEITSIVIGCVGLDCIGQLLNHDNVHRANFLLKLCINENKINKNTIVTLALSNKGLFKDVHKDTSRMFFLNKADNISLIEKGKEIALKIRSSNSKIDFIIIACLKDIIKPIKLIL